MSAAMLFDWLKTSSELIDNSHKSQLAVLQSGDTKPERERSNVLGCSLPGLYVENTMRESRSVLP